MAVRVKEVSRPEQRMVGWSYVVYARALEPGFSCDHRINTFYFDYQMLHLNWCIWICAHVRLWR